MFTHDLVDIVCFVENNYSAPLVRSFDCDVRVIGQGAQSALFFWREVDVSGVNGGV